MDNNQEPVVEPTNTNPYPDMRRKAHKDQFGTASNRDKVVPRNPAKSHPASMKPKPKGA